MPSGNRPDIRIVAKHKEEGYYVDLLAGWENKFGGYNLSLSRDRDGTPKLTKSVLKGLQDGSFFINFYRDTKNNEGVDYEGSEEEPF